MRILLVIWTDKLLEKLSALNPQLEYCAIVVDEVKPAEKILEQVGLSKDLLYPMDELKNCVDTLDYDYVLCVQDTFYDGKMNLMQKCEIPTEKLISFADVTTMGNFQTERPLRYYKAHSQEYEIFATGTSYAETAIDVRKFKRKAINLATSSQDLYYNFQIAKALVSMQGENKKLRYALIGLAPYSFHFDLSKTFVLKCRILPYFIVFNDVHNFPIPADVYKNFIRKEWLAKKFPLKNVNLNGVKSPKVMANPLDNNDGIRPWTGKYYQETHDENIKILDDYLTLCEKNNIRPVMFMAPLTEKYIANFNKQLLDEFYDLVGQARQKHPSALFVDGYKWKGTTYADFYDHQHVNFRGAAKFSTYLNNFIENLEKRGG